MTPANYHEGGYHTLGRPSNAIRITGKNHVPVKRHNSAGDMLETIDQEDSDKLERPRSEGHRYMKQFSPKRTSSYGGQFGRQDSYQKLEQLGEGSYATVYKGFSKWVLVHLYLETKKVSFFKHIQTKKKLMLFLSLFSMHFYVEKIPR